MKKLLLIYSLAAFMIFMVVSCGESKKEQEEPQQSQGTEQTGTENEGMEETAPADSMAAAEETSKEPVLVTGTAANPLKGYAASLNAVVMGTSGKVSQAEAQALANKGQLIVFKSGERIYFVYNTDGSFAGKNLAKHAGGDIGLVGKSKIVNGMNVFIADDIKPIM